MQLKGGTVARSADLEWFASVISTPGSSLEYPRYSQEYLNHVTFTPPQEDLLMAPDGSLDASERTAE